MIRSVELPALQLRIDSDDVFEAKKRLSSLRWNERVILEVGSLLVKAHGLDSVSLLREVWPDAFIVIDLKALKGLEARLASVSGADGATVLSEAEPHEVDRFIEECRKKGIWVYLLSKSWPDELLKMMEEKPDVIVLEKGPFPKTGLKIGIMADSVWKGDRPMEGVDIYIVDKMVWEAEDPNDAMNRLMEVILNG